MSEFYPVKLPAPLRELLLMQARGKLRRTWKKLSSPRRAIPTMLVGVLLLLYVLQVYIAIAYNTSTRVVPIQQLAPIGMLSILLMKLLGVCIDRTKSGAGYRNEEVHHLIGGPYSLDQVRLFRISGHAVSIFFTSVFAAIFFRFHVRSFAAALSGAYMAMLFTYLVYTTVAVAAASTTQRRYRRVRAVGCGVVVALLGLVFYRAAQHGVSNVAFLYALANEAIVLSQTILGRILISPFLVFTKVVMTESVLSWCAWMLPSLTLNYIALQILLKTEVRLEAKSWTREREDFRREEANESLTWSGRSRQSVDLASLHHRIPWLGGAGPIIWRQYKAVRKLRGGLGWLLVPLSVAFALGGYLAYSPEDGAFQPIAVIVVLTSVFLPGLLPFDFRGDLKGLMALKMMPLRARSVVFGQLVVPVLLLSAFQVAALSTLMVHDRSLIGTLLLTMCFLLPTNTIILALENLIFLLYPYRVAEFDMQATVRRIVMLMAKFCVIFIAAVISLAAGFCAVGIKSALKRFDWSVANDAFFQQTLLYSTQLGALTLVALGVFATTCWAYRRFDLAEDLPV